MNKRSTGNDYERLAGDYLKTQGYEILQYNFYTRAGEIDIIAKHQGYLVFVEVKYRTDGSAGHPLEAITIQKQKRISKCALYYMKKQRICDVPVRFDVVGVLGDKVEVVQNAFDFCG